MVRASVVQNLPLLKAGAAHHRHKNCAEISFPYVNKRPNGFPLRFSSAATKAMRYSVNFPIAMSILA